MCCNRKPNRIFKYEFVKPSYKWLAFYECPNCGKRWFEVITEKSDEPKYYYDNAATQLYKERKNRIDNIKQGTKANEYFYFVTFSKHGNHYKTYRTNFNNQKELIGKQKTLVIPL
jgi:5'-deoxynucleotidase YfbR-like HD superfamily hydrolase